MDRQYSRPVTVASLCGASGGNDEYFFSLAEKAAVQKPDIVLFPENWNGKFDEDENSEYITRAKKLAMDNSVYILYPTVVRDGGRSYNRALLIDRTGRIVYKYDKTYPYWPEMPRTSLGAYDQPVFESDFGRIACFICFDANFPDIWNRAGDNGAEIIFWPSAYGAGRQLQAHACNNHYYIVTSTTSGHCMVIDIDGEMILSTHQQKAYVQWITLDLDRCIFHENYNTDKLYSLLNEQPPRIEVEKHLEAEQWFVVRSSGKEFSAREICRKSGMEELRDYKIRSRKTLDRYRSEQ